MTCSRTRTASWRFPFATQIPGGIEWCSLCQQQAGPDKRRRESQRHAENFCVPVIPDPSVTWIN